MTTADSVPITSLNVSVFVVPTERPEADGTLTWNSTTVVTAEPTAGGVTGLGFSYATGACATLIRDFLEDVVVGADAMDVPGVWTDMVRTSRNMGRPGVVSMAIAAVDTALWDLKARLLNVPLCRLLGMVVQEVPVYGSGGFTSLSDDELTQQLEEWVKGDDIPRVKIKVGESWGSNEARDMARAELAREVIGPDAELYIDANGGYTRKQAVRLAREYEELGVTWFEEPVSSDDLAGLHEVRGLTHIDVAAGEYGYDLVYFERMCAAGAVDCLQVDASRCAGITEWFRAAAVAAAHGHQVSAHCAPSLHAHPAAATMNLRHVEYFADHARLDRLLFDGVLDPRRGVLRPDLSRSGMGLEIKRGDAERYRTS